MFIYRKLYIISYLKKKGLDKSIFYQPLIMDPTNLIEYHLCIDNSDNDITQLIQNVRSKFGKSITSEFTRFVHCDMFYEHTAMAHKKTVKTYTKQCVSVEDDGKIKKTNFKKTRGRMQRVASGAHAGGGMVAA
jgi:hypothetical protein